MTRPPPDMILPRRLLHWAATRGDAVAIRQKEFGIWQSHDWADYARTARRFGAGLAALGLPEGGHVAVLSESRREWVVAQMGINLAGGVCVGIYPTSPAPEVAELLKAADVDMLVVEDQEQLDKALEVRAELPRLSAIVVIDPRGTRGYDQAGLRAFDAVLELGAAEEARDPGVVDRRLAAVTPDHPALMIFTSGSTGRPKAAILSHRNIVAAGDAVARTWGIHERDTVVSYLPLCHVAEQIFTVQLPLSVGYAVNFAESLRTVQSDMREIAPTVFLGVPRIWEKLHGSISIKLMETGRLRRWLAERAVASMLRHAGTPRSRQGPLVRLERLFWHVVVFRSLLKFMGLLRARLCFSGAAPISPELLGFFRALDVPIREAYGMTETCGIATGQVGDASPVGTVGGPIEGMEVRLAEDGEILMRGAQVFAGYYRDPAATAAAVRDGWLHSGDVGERVGDEYRIVDRKKDILITAGGKNLSPSEIENGLKSSPYIREAVAIGDRRPYVAALIQIDADTVGKWAETQGIAHTTFRSLAENDRVRALVAAEVEKANARMPRVAHVRRFHLLAKELDHDDGEVTATMKVRRKAVAELFADEIAALYAAEDRSVA